MVLRRHDQTFAIVLLVTERDMLPVRHTDLVQGPKPQLVSVTNTVEVEVTEAKALGVTSEVRRVSEELEIGQKLVEPVSDGSEVGGNVSAQLSSILGLRLPG